MDLPVTAEVVRNRFRARINKILQQPASPNLDFDGQESVFYRVETLSNTVVSVRWDNIITLWLWSAAGQGFQNNDWQSHIFLKCKESKEPTQFKVWCAD